MFALYKMMYMFLSPMLWAALVGTVLFPFKKKVTDVVKGIRLSTRVQEAETPLVIGILTLPICGVRSFSEKIYSTAMSSAGVKIIAAYVALRVLTYDRTFVYIIGFLGRLYNAIDTFIVFFSQPWMFPIMVLYFVAYTAWIYVQPAGAVNKKVARTLSLPIW
ncbi:unnamed protein product [Heligmosomoides polygyrus]|uniref:Uncharacterized protein n=1 Tax=Heligmosomoides polygyrus TaxID=6339 RepID=A0A3P8D347_HELPZ|nr:unnamed protein product [Heligmosomoides polygyrus]